MPLSEVKCRNAKPASKPYKLTDGGGLFLLVSTSGARLWRFKFRFQSREQLRAYGAYPEVSLAKVRELHAADRKLLAAGQNPSEAWRQEKVRKEHDTFAALYREWFDSQVSDWAPSNTKKIEQLAEANLLPYLQHRPVAEVRPPELLAVLRRIEKRGALDLARRCGAILEQVFGLALASGRAETNPALGLKKLLRKPITKNRAAVVTPEEVAQLMSNIAAYKGGPVVRSALQLSALTFQRPGEIRQMKWADVDLDKAEWLVRVETRKLKIVEKRTAKPHWVPLARQAVQALRELEPLTGRSEFVFPSERTRKRPMSDGAVLSALRAMGYSAEQMSAHGFRAIARTLLAEMGWRTDAIERQLAHKPNGPHGAAYDRAQFLEERRQMMQAWADHLDLAAKLSDN